MEKVAQWLSAVAAASVGATLLQMLAPKTKGGIEKYVKFVSGSAVLLTVIMMVLGIFKSIEGNLDKTGIFSPGENINITETTQRDKWILSETLESLESGVKRLVKQKFAVDVQVEFKTDISQSGIEIKSATISSKEIIYAKMVEIAMYLEEYLGIEVNVGNE